MSEPTVFDKIVSGELPSQKVWEDDDYMAFLSRWPSTPGYTVVIPKKNPGDNYIDVDDDAYVGLLLAARKVAVLLRKAFNTYRVGLVVEGEGVPHLHVKLIPMHGVTKEKRAYKHEEYFTDVYEGFLNTGNGPEMSEEDLQKTQAKITKANDEN